MTVKDEASLKRTNLTLWLALKHHRTHKKTPLNFKDHLYLKRIYAIESEYCVIIKSTQCGISEYELVRTVSHALQGLSVFVAFPTDILVSRFVNGRFSKSFQHTPYYKQIEVKLKDQGEKRVESLRMMDIGPGTVIWVGSNSEANFTEFPADEIIIEELDQCDQKNIKMAPERLSHSNKRYQLWISNPTYEGLGIDDKFADTNQMEWQIKADCGHWVKLDWFRNVVQEIERGRYRILDEDWDWESSRDIYPICHKCHKPINRRLDGLWIPNFESRKDGYRISKLYSGSNSIVEMLDRFTKGLTDDRELQRFYNADLGFAFTSAGAKITEKMITDCAGTHAEGAEEGVNIVGIDVGTFYYYVIMRMLPDGRMKVLYLGKEKDTNQLIQSLREYKITVGIIDGLPETREAKKISHQFNLLYLCYFGTAKNDSIDFARKSVTVQRTPSLDAVKEALLLKQIIYPQNIKGNTEYINHMKASTRILNKEARQGGQTGVYQWVEGSKDDHFFLATGYALIARRLLVLISDQS